MLVVGDCVCRCRGIAQPYENRVAELAMDGLYNRGKRLRRGVCCVPLA